MSSVSNLVIVGGGPTGLSAAINGASEMSGVVVIDSGRKISEGHYERQVGGQAIGSTSIENYPGFPEGISGCDLMKRFEEQALRLEAVIHSPLHASALTQLDNGLKRVVTREGQEFISKAVLLSPGLSYNKLDAPGIETLLGRGVLYGSPTSPAEQLGSCTVCVVGGANSAGQAVVHLTHNPNIQIKMLIRGKRTLDDQMSAYLVKRIRDCPRVEVLQDRGVVEAFGADRLEGIRVRSGDGGEEVINTDHLFIYIGAAPKTKWLDGAVVKDKRSFIVTGDDLGNFLGPKIAFETSMPGVFAAGDIRLNSVKRVAAAVGEGSAVLASIHQYLREAQS